MPKVDVRAKVAEQARQDFGVEPIAVVDGEDVYGGLLALLPDRVVFYKELFGDLEKRGEYPYAEVTEVAVRDGFGGKEISGRFAGKEMRLRRLAPDDAELLQGCFLGQVPSPAQPAAVIAPPVPPPTPQRPKTRPQPRPRAEAEPPPRRAVRAAVAAAPTPEVNEEDWFEETPVTRRAAVAAAKPAAEAPAQAKKGAGCLAWLVILALAAAGFWYAVELTTRIDRISGQGDEAEVLRAEMLATREETHKDIEALHAELAELRSSLAAGDEIDPWPTAPPLQPLDGSLVGYATDQPPSEETFRVPIGDAPSRGPDKAWVTVVVMCDFQSPHCGNAGRTMADLRKSYDKNLREVFRHLPSDINDRAFAAAHAAECAREQGGVKFWRYHDYVLANQKLLSTTPMPEIVKKAGVSMPKWKKCYDLERHEERIAADVVFADRYGVAWAPAFFVNGRLLPGAQTQGALEKVIDEELAKAKASGIPKGQYYRKAVLEQGVEP